MLSFYVDRNVFELFYLCFLQPSISNINKILFNIVQNLSLKNIFKMPKNFTEHVFLRSLIFLKYLKENILGQHFTIVKYMSS